MKQKQNLASTTLLCRGSKGEMPVSLVSLAQRCQLPWNSLLYAHKDINSLTHLYIECSKPFWLLEEMDEGRP